MFFTVKKVQRNEITGIYLVCFLLYIKLHVTSSQSTIFEKFGSESYNSGVHVLQSHSRAELSTLSVHQMADSPDCLQPPHSCPDTCRVYMAVNTDINYRTAHYMKPASPPSRQEDNNVPKLGITHVEMRRLSVELRSTVPERRGRHGRDRLRPASRGIESSWGLNGAGLFERRCVEEQLLGV